MQIYVGLKLVTKCTRRSENCVLCSFRALRSIETSKVLPMHSQEGQTPQLPNIALRGGEVA